MRETIFFISTMASIPFGGSEELWTRTATLLTKQGVRVAASVHGWPELDPRITRLFAAGVDLRPRSITPSLMSRVRRYMAGQTPIVFDIQQSFGDNAPSLVVISNGSPLPPIELVEMCVAKQWPFATVGHSFSSWWISDDIAARYRQVLPVARRCFFVSQANRVQTERQLGCDLENAEIVRNPVTIDISSPIPWLPINVEHELRMACVGTLFPTTKGQDVLLEVLAEPRWRARNWRLCLYGNGPTRDLLERLVKRFKLEDRVFFGGYVAPEEIWRENHILILPSRQEGMSITIVEAMFCGRPVVATNVGGNSELVKDDVTGFLAEAATAECFGKALERMWTRRSELVGLGKVAAVKIREFMPADPVGIFAKKLRELSTFSSRT